VEQAREERAEELQAETLEAEPTPLPDATSESYRRSIERCTRAAFQLAAIGVGMFDPVIGSSLFDGSPDAAQDATDLLVEWLAGRAAKIFRFASVAVAFGRKAIDRRAAELHELAEKAAHAPDQRREERPAVEVVQ